ncbi:MAG: hypothetical protein IT553_03075 [Sphingomonadaceae bacterium]|nr:hypothetical protein [Sphingomonadaceae bacterium]
MADTRFAVSLFGRRVTPWRDTREAAQRDAVRKRLGDRDDWAGGRFYADVGVRIISEPAR